MLMRQHQGVTPSVADAADALRELDSLAHHLDDACRAVLARRRALEVDATRKLQGRERVLYGIPSDLRSLAAPYITVAQRCELTPELQVFVPRSHEIAVHVRGSRVPLVTAHSLPEAASLLATPFRVEVLCQLIASQCPATRTARSSPVRHRWQIPVLLGDLYSTSPAFIDTYTADDLARLLGEELAAAPRVAIVLNTHAILLGWGDSWDEALRTASHPSVADRVHVLLALHQQLRAVREDACAPLK